MTTNQPLAARMRPTTLDEVVGQDAPDPTPALTPTAEHADEPQVSTDVD